MRSSQESVLDKISLAKVDFTAYMQGREEAEQAVRPADSFIEQLHDRVLGNKSEIGARLPWGFTHDKFRLRPGEVTLWYGINGHKKSMVTGFVAVDLMAQGHKVAIASFEMAPVATLGRMLPQAQGEHCYKTQQADEFIGWCEDRLWIYDKRGSVKTDAIIGAVYYCAEQLGVRHFFIDSLMKCVKGDDDYSGQKDFVDNLCSAAIETKTHVHLIHHSKKLADQNARPGKFDAKGSGAIVDQVDNAISVFKIPEEKKSATDPDNGIFIDKQRNGEWEGKVMTWFDRDSLQFLEDRGAKPKVYINKGVW